MAEEIAGGVRPPAVAGLFYPAERDRLAATVDRLLAECRGGERDPPPIAIIAPHAGYDYSGPIAARAHARLLPLAGAVRRVVLLGPAHRAWFRGIARPGAGALATPLGPVRVDRQAASALSKLPFVRIFDRAFEGEHSLEVHLPFLQRALGEFAVTPLLVGEASAAEVAETIAALAGEAKTLIVISSDLSHYEPYGAAAVHDAATAAAIERLDGDALGPDDACGCIPIRGLLLEARRRGLVCRRLDLRNSGDTAGGRSRVVGYGAWMFFKETG